MLFLDAAVLNPQASCMLPWKFCSCMNIYTCSLVYRYSSKCVHTSELFVSSPIMPYFAN